MADSDCPVTFKRVTALPLDKSTYFTSTNALNAYLMDPTRYPGQPVILVENDTVSFKHLSADGESWEDGWGTTSLSISTVDPSADGDATPGATGKVSDAGHIHPHDTTKVDTTTFNIHTGTASTTTTSGHVTLCNDLVSVDSTKALTAAQGYLLAQNKAPNSHAVTETIYGVASATNYGHVRVLDLVTSSSTTDALSANQGNVLKGLIDSKSASSHGHSVATTLATGFMPVLSGNAGQALLGDGSWGTFSTVSVVDSLVSNSTTSALSANQGLVLKGLVDGKSASGHAHAVATVSSAGFLPVLSGNAGQALLGDGSWGTISNVSVVDNLLSTSTTSALSANQGYTLKGLVDGKANSTHAHSVATNSSTGFMPILSGSQSDALRGDGSWVTVSTVSVVDSLVSNSTTSALSANQGLVLKGLVDGKAATSHTTPAASTSAVGHVQLNDTLVSTSTTLAATANAAKQLKDLVDGKAETSHTTPAASTSAVGHVQLSDSITSTSTTLAATANAVKQVNDLLAGKADGTHTSVAATTTVVGHVQLNDTMVSTSTTEAATANAVRQVKAVADGKASATRVLTTLSGFTAQYSGEIVQRKAGTYASPDELDGAYMEFGGGLIFLGGPS